MEAEKVEVVGLAGSEPRRESFFVSLMRRLGRHLLVQCFGFLFFNLKGTEAEFTFEEGRRRQ